MPGWGIVALVIMGALLLVGIWKLVNTVRSGVDLLSGAVELSKNLAEQRNDEPRSLSSVTDLVLPRIRRDFPEYNFELIKMQVKRDAEKYLRDKGRGSVRVHNIVIHDYLDSNRDKVIAYQAACEYAGPEGSRIQTRLELPYIAMFSQDPENQNVSFTCPNCGAPVSQVGSKVCPYCGTGLAVSARLAWTLLTVTED